MFILKCKGRKASVKSFEVFSILRYPESVFTFCRALKVFLLVLQRVHACECNNEFPRWSREMVAKDHNYHQNFVFSLWKFSFPLLIAISFMSFREFVGTSIQLMIFLILITCLFH